MHKPLVPCGQRSSSPISGSRILSIVMIGIMISATGCTYAPILRSTLAPYDEIKCRSVVDMKARIRARAIWHDKYAQCYRNRNNGHHVKRGFIDGFVDTALGGTGCPPLVAPQYCLSSGASSGHAWFEGWPLGVAAAESIGADRWTKNTVLSPHLRACFAKEGCNAGCSPCGTIAGSGGCGQPGCSGGCNGAGAAMLPPQAMIHDGMLDQDGAMIIDSSVPQPMADAAPDASDEQVPPAPAVDNDVDQNEDAVNEDDFTSVVPIVPQVEKANVPTPAITGPVSMPNLQVSFDDEPGSVFDAVEMQAVAPQANATR